jgi:hypothetical protein
MHPEETFDLNPFFYFSKVYFLFISRGVYFYLPARERKKFQINTSNAQMLFFLSLFFVSNYQVIWQRPGMKWFLSELRTQVSFFDGRASSDYKPFSNHHYQYFVYNYFNFKKFI